jgi:hypothetical protein
LPGWYETFSLDFFAADASLGGSVVLTLRPDAGHSWFWACVVGRNRPLVAVYEHETPLPARDSLEVRSSGLWLDIECEIPFDHVTLGVEAFGLSLDDPAEVFGACRGDLTPVGFDLEWETDGAPEPGPAATTAGRYELPCRVHGDVLVGEERVEFDGWGHREHRWGDDHRWTTDWSHAALRRDDGRWQIGDEPPAMELLEIVAHAPVAVDGPQGVTRLERVLAQVRLGDGATAVGWLARHRTSPGILLR